MSAPEPATVTMPVDDAVELEPVLPTFPMSQPVPVHAPEAGAGVTVTFAVILSESTFAPSAPVLASRIVLVPDAKLMEAVVTSRQVVQLPVGAIVRLDLVDPLTRTD